MNTMTYKGYTAHLDYGDEDKLVVGRILGIRDIVSFKPIKNGMHGGWFWSLPTKESEGSHENPKRAIQNSMATFGMRHPSNR